MLLKNAKVSLINLLLLPPLGLISPPYINIQSLWYLRLGGAESRSLSTLLFIPKLGGLYFTHVQQWHLLLCVVKPSRSVWSSTQLLPPEATTESNWNRRQERRSSTMTSNPPSVAGKQATKASTGCFVTRFPIYILHLCSYSTFALKPVYDRYLFFKRWILEVSFQL